MERDGRGVLVPVVPLIAREGWVGRVYRVGNSNAGRGGEGKERTEEETAWGEELSLSQGRSSRVESRGPSRSLEGEVEGEIDEWSHGIGDERRVW